MINGDTKIYSLYGSPVAHSLSPVIFNTAFQKLSMNSAYVPFEVKTDQLKQAVEAARTLGFEGFNVTMPLKVAIQEMTDRLDKSAQESGSVNTVVQTGKRLVGYNTDGEGAVRALRSYGFEPRDKRIVMLGAGGAARALVSRFSKEGNRITILNRTKEKARQVADSAAGNGGTSYDDLNRNSLESNLQNTDLLVNATPIQTSDLLSKFQIPIRKAKGRSLIFDLAYDKAVEPLSSENEDISPLEMLVQQAALSYEIWFNEKAPFALMRSSLVSHLGKDWK